MIEDSPVETALVTGANRGIGFESAAGLAKLGWRVLLGVRDVRQGAAAARQLAEFSSDVHPVTLDVTDESAVVRAAAGPARTRPL